jgi:hypothetical protein
LQLWYAYAKTLAEKEAWRIAKEYGIDLRNQKYFSTGVKINIAKEIKIQIITYHTHR